MKKKQMEEAEIKRQEMMAAQKEGGKKSSGPAMDARKEMSKTKEQVGGWSSYIGSLFSASNFFRLRRR